MSVEVECPQCGRRCTVDDESAGTLSRCNGCGMVMRIPGAPPAPEAAPPRPDLPKEMLANRTLAGRACPICSRMIALGEPVRNCQLCGTTHHSACWQSHGGCSTADCANAPLPEIAPSPASGVPTAPAAAFAPDQAATKPCPFCGERIAAAAIKCRFCGEYLAAPGRPAGVVITRTCGFAVASLVLGIVSVICCGLGLVLGPLAIAFGISGRNKILQSGGMLVGSGMAAAGLALGIIGTVLSILTIIIRVVSETSGW